MSLEFSNASTIGRQDRRPIVEVDGMNIREKFNENKWLGVGVPVAIVAVSLAILLMEVFGGRSISGISDKAYFTTDDTLTGEAAVDALFVAPVSNVPPFDHDGKPAYRASVWTCNGGRTLWVQSLWRYTPKVRDQVVAAYAAEAAKGDKTDPYLDPFNSGLEVKAPGNGPWVRSGSASAAKIIQPSPPPGVPSDDLNLKVP
jgi:hypothetical protein